MLSISQWNTEADFDRFLEHPAAQAAILEADPPARILRLSVVRIFAFMSRRPAVIACGLVSGVPERAAELEAFLVEKARSGLDLLEGLVSEELFRVDDGSGRFLQVHCWRSAEDLEHFRTALGPRVLAELSAFGATVERFVGQLAAEYVRPPAAVDR